MAKERMPSFKELPGLVISHPFGLLIAIIFFAVLLMYGGVMGCALKSILYASLGNATPNCNPENIIRFKVGEWIIGLFNHASFIWTVLILGTIVFIYFKRRGK